ncbi:MAG TPA: nitronate monooxygenase [Spirochaetota bacterium]|nr:nitronate monooxygenase [Spirochaetota bacterium]HPI90526.1 nitronate monooxygenase [Spirochaetota bacterium]HPR47874.1 nitronate monooxygenase [Spirochaetota bacterium]
MKTAITELLQIEYPIVLSGMSWISTPELVAAVSNAGGIGILATGILSPEETVKSVKNVRELTSKPFAANVTLYFPGSEQNAKTLIDLKVPVINYSLGKGGWIADAVHAYGGKVIATVTTLKHALAAQREGADALIVTGHEAAAHGGAVTSLALIPAIADAVDIPIIAAGGFADGRGLAAALALGAGGVAMGTRLMNTVESPVHELQKKMSVDRGAFDTVYTDRVDGMNARMMDSAGVRYLMKKRLNPFMAMMKASSITREIGIPMTTIIKGMLFPPKRSSSAKKNNPSPAAGSTPAVKKKSGGFYPKMKKMFRTMVQLSRMAIGFGAFKLGTMDGDNKKGVLPLGQITGIIHDTPSVKEVVDRTVAEAEKVYLQLGKSLDA